MLTKASSCWGNQSKTELLSVRRQRGSHTVLSHARNLERYVSTPISGWTPCTAVGQGMFCMAWMFSGSAWRLSDPSMWPTYATLLSLKHNFFLFSFRLHSLHLSRRTLNATSWDAVASSLVSLDPKITMSSWFTEMFSRPSRHSSSRLWNSSGADLILKGTCSHL